MVNEEKAKKTNVTPKKNTKKEEIKEIEKIEEEKVETSNEIEEVKEETELQKEEISVLEEKPKKKKNIFLRILKIIILVILAPIWVPWHVLFVRRKSRKFNKMSKGIKIFRIVRAPITWPLKFGVFLIIIFLELFCFYKIRFSAITYPITRSSVRSYYLNTDKNQISDDNIERLEEAFSYIDDWDIDSKNKMYVILNSEVSRTIFDIAPDVALEYYLDEFNNNSNFREDMRIVTKNINKSLNRALNEIPSIEDELNEMHIKINPGVIDYSMALRIADTALKTVTSLTNYEKEKIDDDEFNPEDFDIAIDAIVMFSKGSSLKEVEEYLNSHDSYLND